MIVAIIVAIISILNIIITMSTTIIAITINHELSLLLSGALHLFDMMKKDSDRTAQSLLKILPLLLSPGDSRKLLQQVTGGDRYQGKILITRCIYTYI
jgi:hypothetical protein